MAIFSRKLRVLPHLLFVFFLSQFRVCVFESSIIFILNRLANIRENIFFVRILSFMKILLDPRPLAFDLRGFRQQILFMLLLTLLEFAIQRFLVFLLKMIGLLLVLVALVILLFDGRLRLTF